MSIAGVGAHSTPNLSQMLSSLLSRLDTASTSSASKTADDTASNSAISSASGGSAMLAGPSRPSLSSMILGTLIGLQQQSGSSEDSTAASSSSDPVQNLFSAMDSDSDGTVTQSELEGYIEQQGGTQTQADNLYSMLDTSGSKGITESDLASDAPQGPPPGPPPGGLDGTSPFDSASDVGSKLLRALDSNSDGSVNKSEFEDFVTANGGAAAEADKDFSALDTSGSGSLSSSNFTAAIEKQQSGNNSGSYSPVLMLLDAFAQNASSGSTLSLTA
jgi:Ca2+-binding EF-hand superfamily protein